MTKVVVVPKRAIAVLNGIAIALIVAGCLDFALISHSFGRSRIYLVAAFGSLTLAALISRIRARGEDVPSKRGTSAQESALAPLWVYAYVVLCFALMVITLTTHLIESKVVGLVVATAFGMGLVAVLVNRARANAGRGFGFSRVQKIGIIVAFIGLVLGIIRLVIGSL